MWGSETLGGSLAASPPVASTGSASGVTSTGAKLQGSVNPEEGLTKYFFQYGKTTAYGSKQPAAEVSLGYGNTSIAVSQSVSGLSPSTLYHYRVVATSPEGTTLGSDVTFTTPAT